MVLCNFGHFYLVSRIFKKIFGARALKLIKLIDNDEYIT